MWEKMERRFGKYAIPRLMNYVIGGYVLGFLLVLGSQLTSVNYLSYLYLDPYQIFHAGVNGMVIPQIWRIITWVFIPPISGLGLFDILIFAIVLVFYWQLGTVLERSWGTFRFNVFIFGGILLTILGSFLLYAFTPDAIVNGFWIYSRYFTTNYINMSIFLAFALCYPDMTVMLYFIIPIKMKYMAIVYGVITGWNLFTSIASQNWGRVVLIVASVINFLWFYFSTRDAYRVTARRTSSRGNFRQRYGANFQGPFGQNQKTEKAQSPIHHKCCICGRTDVSNPELTFRYCSKCKGNNEYCQDHLFTHTHIV